MGLRRLSILLVISLAAAGSAGCQELEARRLVQKADALYLDGQTADAIPLYEQALAKSPDLLIGQHNAALAYYKLFKPGIETPENLEYAKKASEHFLTYLAAEPGDSAMQQLLTKTWQESGQVDEAVAFWKEKLDADPNNRDVLTQLAAVNIGADRTQEGLGWLWKLADAEKENAAKIQAYVQIASVAMGRLRKESLVDMDRLELADQGIAACQLGLELAPENMQLHGLLNAIYTGRAEAHGASWARLLDLAAARSHWNQYRELEEKAKKANAAAKPEGDKAEDKEAGK